jgi:hypothetical protein
MAKLMHLLSTSRILHSLGDNLNNHRGMCAHEEGLFMMGFERVFRKLSNWRGSRV